MADSNSKPWIPLLAILVVVALLVTIFFASRGEGQVRGARQQEAPVEVSPVRTGSIALIRTFNGSLESMESFVVAPKVAGEIEAIRVDIGDEVVRGEILVELNDEEFQQDLAQAEAELKVAEANLISAENNLKIANREFERVQTLQERGVSSEAEFDRAQAEKLSRSAQMEVARAQVARQQAAVESAQIRLGYTRVTAEWKASREGNGRFVGERYVDEGQIVAANEPLFSVVKIKPIVGVFFVTERDYSRIGPGQEVRIRADAYPNQQFFGAVSRIAPVFQEQSRQARVEVAIENEEQLLKPGMFIRAEVTLETNPEATIIPFAGLTRRDNEPGVFLLDPEAMTVRWQTVEIGIREGDDVAIRGIPRNGRVVTLGHQLLDDGSAVVLPGEAESDSDAR